VEVDLKDFPEGTDFIGREITRGYFLLAGGLAYLRLLDQ